MPRGVYARNKSLNKKVNSEDIDIVGGEREFKVGDVAGVGLDMPETDNELIVGGDADKERFNHDVLTVQFMPPGNENEPKFAEVNVNGKRIVARRGDTVKMRRFQVAVLAQSKIARIEQLRVNGPDGNPQYVEREVFSQTYPFSVVEDPDPRGRAWLKQQLANPV